MCSTMWSTCFNKCLKSAKLRYKSREWWYPYQPHLGTQIHRCGCSKKQTTTVSFTLIYKALEDFILIKQVINRGLIEPQIRH